MPHHPHSGIFGFPLEAHFIFEVLAYTIGYRYYAWLRSRSGDTLPGQQRLVAVVGAMLGAMIGSKGLGLLETPEVWPRLLDQPLLIFASKTIVGGLLGGLAGVEIAKKLAGIRQSTGDLFTYPLILGMMIGRVGCFLAGVEDGTHGSPTSLPIGIDMGDGIPRHPVALYEILCLGGIWLGLRLLERRYTLASGARFKLFMVAYLLWRLSIDFIKPIPPVPGIGLAPVQLACIAGLLYYWRVWLRPGSLFSSSKS